MCTRAIFSSVVRLTAVGLFLVCGRVLGGSPPVAVSLSPSGTTLAVNASAVVTSIYSDADGAENLSAVYLLLNSTTSGANGIYVAYNRQNNKLYLRNDADTAWLGGFAPGQATIVENSRARLRCQNTSVSLSGNTLTINWNIEPKSPVAGSTLKAYLRGLDISGLHSGWVQKGSLTFGNAPVAGTITPASGNPVPGSKATVSCNYNDPDGVDNLAAVYFLINASASGANGILLAYNRQTNKLYLRNDADTGWLGGVSPGSPGTISNSRARLYCQETTVSSSSQGLTVNWRIEPLATMGGRLCKGYLRALDVSGLGIPWTEKATYSFKSFPVAQSITPGSANLVPGLKQSVACVYSDPDGLDDLSAVYFLINASASGANGILLAYNRQTNKLYLRNDADTGWLGGVSPGSPGTISNSRARLYCQETTVSSSSQGLTVNWRIEPLATMGGRLCKGYLRALDVSGLGIPWTEKATYSFKSFPVAQSITPGSANLVPGLKQSVACVYSDPDGLDDLSAVYFLINASASGANGIMLAYNRQANKLYLRNDADTGWLGGVSPGSPGTISNSRARLYCQETTVSSSSQGLTVNWRIEPLATMGGRSCKGYLRALDVSGLGIPWTEKATLTISRRPSNDDFSPNSAEVAVGSPTLLTARFSDPDGAGNLSVVYVLLNSTLNGSGAGYVLYELPPKNKLWLRNDAHSAWLGGFAPGSANIIENGQFRLYCDQTSATTSGSTLQLNLKLEAKQAMAERSCQAWLRCTDSQGLTADWTNKGSIAFFATPSPSTIAVFPARLVLKQGGNPAVIRAAVIDASGKVVSNPETNVTWTVANTSLATVESLGMDGLGEYWIARVTPSASSAGSTTLQVSANGLSARIDLAVAGMPGWEELHPSQNPLASATIAQGQQRVYFFQTEPDFTYMVDFESANHDAFRMELFDNPSLSGPPLLSEESSDAGWDIPATRSTGTWFVRLTRLAPSSGSFSITLEADPNVYNTEDSPSVPVWHRLDPGGPIRFGTVGRRDSLFFYFDAEAGRTYYVEGGGPGVLTLAEDAAFTSVIASSESEIGRQIVPSANRRYYLRISGGQGGGFAGARVSLPNQGYVSQPVLQLYPRTLLMDQEDSRTGDLALQALVTGLGTVQDPPATVTWSASVPQISVTGTGVQDGAQRASVVMGSPVNGRIQVAGAGQRARITHFGFIPTLRAMGADVSLVEPGVAATGTIAAGGSRYYYMQTIPGAVYQFVTERLSGDCNVYLETWRPPIYDEGDEPIPDLFVAQCPWAVGTIAIRVENPGEVECQYRITVQLVPDSIQAFVPYTMEQIIPNGPMQERRLGFYRLSVPYEEEALLYFDSPDSGVPYRLTVQCDEGEVDVQVGEETTFASPLVQWNIPAEQSRAYSFTPPSVGKRYFVRIRGLQAVNYFQYGISVDYGP
ncbi:MAG: hypothetical protein KatS3mg024_2537 [Armatimonadota bacterium]|nr:MAG: hypothetical protein KatS3mg024_2537 [Armatimonadota bacterium]